MRAFDILLEKHYTGPLYHSTNIENANRIIQADKFFLSYANINSDSSIEGKIRRNLGKEKKYIYYLSTSRNKLNGYRKNNVGLDTTFVLDSMNINKNPNYIIKPLDYFYYSADEDVFHQDFFDDRRRTEAEERIWSTRNFLSIDFILEMHVYVSVFSNLDAFTDYVEIVKTYDKIKKSGNKIKCFYYDKFNSYIKLQKNKAIGTRVTIGKVNGKPDLIIK